jgi:hypothetical protein
MKMGLKILTLGLTLTGFTAGARAETIIGWDMSNGSAQRWGANNTAPTYIIDNVTTGGLTANNTNNSGTPAANSWGAVFLSGGSVTFTLDVAVGYELSLTSFDNFWTRHSTSGPNGGSISFSVDGGPNTLISAFSTTSTSTSPTNSLTAALQDLTTIDALQHLTGSVTFTIGLNGSGNWYLMDRSAGGTGAYELSLQGLVTPLAMVPEPSTYVLLGAGAGILILAQLRRGKA